MKNNSTNFKKFWVLSFIPTSSLKKVSLQLIFQEDSHWDVKHNQAAKGFNAKTTPPSINGNGTSQQSNNSVPTQNKLGKHC